MALKFGTAGLRGVLGAGTNRMNIYVVRQATQGLKNTIVIMTSNIGSSDLIENMQENGQISPEVEQRVTSPRPTA